MLLLWDPVARCSVGFNTISTLVITLLDDSAKTLKMNMQNSNISFVLNMMWSLSPYVI